jgi:alpha-D-ribose 1-methylphosphonate 5-triphosphate synthase subunit PhnG
MPQSQTSPTIAARQEAMRICAEAAPAELVDALAALAVEEPVEDLRRPDTGLVMLRGRIGGDGRAFNMGEATVTRAAIRLAGGSTGFAWHLGRDAARARNAAILDALWQDEARRPLVEEALSPIAKRLADEKARSAARVAATKVNFFTMVRGED